MGSTWALGLLLMRSHTDKETGSESPCQPLLSPAVVMAGQQGSRGRWGQWHLPEALWM